ncbi:ABC transporter substrate-binding protein [Falsirhodobacter sp. 20TX0035]|uniref:ABC transporter substrate-binding protein n=1 Tax=Falsirhodobacter sp. 20TX0035 TaxID=3022019 RepID=UPI00232D6AAC|nr:ABC transporter substrate-binding protein [Falsirhodobacter sp. 20TX0035]MDB6452895.1 ABC transporter substrate-binding protein [Falsirhodobacter sp. 20TX0035]
MVGRGLRAAALACGLALPAAAGDAPARVVSMNLCTDQLALMLAAPGQLVSVSALSQDPRASVMAAEAQALPPNHGLAEEIFLLRPDLVLAGRFSSPATLDMLRRLGLRVETFDPESTLDDIRANLRRMGEVLGRDATRTIAQFDADLAALPPPATPRPRAASYGANSYAEGPDSLAGQIIAAAGFTNIAAERGLSFGGTLPLEVLMLASPDLILRGAPYPGASRAEAVLDHPGLRHLAPQHRTDRDWVCGTPRILHAITDLQKAAAP